MRQVTGGRFPSRPPCIESLEVLGQHTALVRRRSGFDSRLDLCDNGDACAKGARAALQVACDGFNSRRVHCIRGGTDVEVEYLNGRKLFVIPQFLTPEECEAFIERSEQARLRRRPDQHVLRAAAAQGRPRQPRILLDDPELATAWWGRARGCSSRSGSAGRRSA